MVSSDGIAIWEICIQMLILHVTTTSCPYETLCGASASASSVQKTVRLRVPSQQHDAYLDLFSVQSYRLLEIKVMIAGDAGRYYLVITGVV